MCCGLPALKLEPDYLKALLRRSQPCEELEKYEDALQGTYVWVIQASHTPHLIGVESILNTVTTLYFDILCGIVAYSSGQNKVPIAE